MDLLASLIKVVCASHQVFLINADRYLTGYAIWIGNLPPQTELMSLVRHVYKEASGLQSLFLIWRSNCAFANFKDEATCASAQAKIHDSRFRTFRLVSRLRRGCVGTKTTGMATGPAAFIPPSDSLIARSPSPETLVASQTLSPSTFEAEGRRKESPTEPNRLKNKFFIVKSLTVEDLEVSVRNSIWATQSHNEDSFNKAYQVRCRISFVLNNFSIESVLTYFFLDCG